MLHINIMNVIVRTRRWQWHYLKWHKTHAAIPSDKFVLQVQSRQDGQNLHTTLLTKFSLDSNHTSRRPPSISNTPSIWTMFLALSFIAFIILMIIAMIIGVFMFCLGLALVPFWVVKRKAQGKWLAPQWLSAAHICHDVSCDTCLNGLPYYCLYRNTSEYSERRYRSFLDPNIRHTHEHIIHSQGDLPTRMAFSTRMVFNNNGFSTRLSDLVEIWLWGSGGRN